MTETSPLGTAQDYNQTYHLSENEKDEHSCAFPGVEIRIMTDQGTSPTDGKSMANYK
jgi:hypothetical protein